MRTPRTILLAAAASLATVAGARAATYDHVLLISVDGMHAADLVRYVLDPAHASSALSQLSRHGVIYPLALTTAPSDSFPGMIAQFTGATPRTAEVWYDDSFDRTLYPVGSNCQGPAGAETNYAENIDVDQNRVDAGGTLGQPFTQIDFARLPLALNAQSHRCFPVLPHQFIRTNTLFEVLHGQGRRTAWADKHPAYEILNGPSGTGIDDLFTPEVNSQLAGAPAGEDWTTSFSGIQRNDELKVQAVLNEIDGLDSTGSRSEPVPAIMGLDFQSVSVGQKLATAGYGDAPDLRGGYLDAYATPGNALTEELAYVDDAIGRMTGELATQGLARRTLVIVSAKHGQSPIDVTQRRAIPDTFSNTPGYAHDIADDEALIWLKPQVQSSDFAAARSYLQTNANALGIQYLLPGKDLGAFYPNPDTDSRTPDFIGVSTHGVIYTTGTKLAEHGGFSLDDRNVALLVSNPNLEQSVNFSLVQTTQIAPTILEALGDDPAALQGVIKEGTRSLPGL